MGAWRVWNRVIARYQRHDGGSIMRAKKKISSRVHSGSWRAVKAQLRASRAYAKRCGASAEHCSDAALTALCAFGTVDILRRHSAAAAPAPPCLRRCRMSLCFKRAWMDRRCLRGRQRVHKHLRTLRLFLQAADKRTTRVSVERAFSLHGEGASAHGVGGRSSLCLFAAWASCAEHGVAWHNISMARGASVVMFALASAVAGHIVLNAFASGWRHGTCVVPLPLLWRTWRGCAPLLFRCFQRIAPLRDTARQWRRAWLRRASSVGIKYRGMACLASLGFCEIAAWRCERASCGELP